MDLRPPRGTLDLLPPEGGRMRALYDAFAASDHERARERLLKAVEVNPEYWRAHLSLGVTMHRLQRYDEALAVYTRAAGMNPDVADTHAYLGWVLIMLGRRTVAIRVLQIAVRLDPGLHAERAYLTSRYGVDERSWPTSSAGR